MKKAGALAVVVVVVCGACGDRPAANPNANTINVPMMPADLGRGDAAPPDEAIEADRARQAEFERMRAERKKFEEEQPPRPTDGDPQNGKWTLDDATAGLAGTGPITATIKTTKGDMKCKLFDDKAPIAVANFVGLARGLRPFRTSRSSGWEKRPVYDGTIFHRVIKGFMIQGGDPLRNGSGEGGYVFADEVWSGAKHDRAGLLCMANRGKNTNGVQFFITDAAAAHLDGGYTIFGECAPLSVVHAIANVPVAGEHPTTDVTITTVEITRAATAATPATPATPTTPTTPKASPPKPKTGDPGF